MKCPKCGAQEGIKWFLRHQAEGPDDDSNLANAITILCTKCGANESYMLQDCLSDIFFKWSTDSLSNFGAIASMFGNMSGTTELPIMEE